jgi:hypothetical protein
MNIRKIKLTLKDKLINIKPWKKISDPSFDNNGKQSVFLTVTNFTSTINTYQDIKVNGGVLNLDFVVGKTFISYSVDESSIFDISKKDLMKLSKINNYKIIKFPKIVGFDELLYVTRKLIENGYKIIPLDDTILIFISPDDEDQYLEIEVGQFVYKTEDIE